jgi:hypothetical protein
MLIAGIVVSDEENLSPPMSKINECSIKPAAAASFLNGDLFAELVFYSCGYPKKVGSYVLCFFCDSPPSLKSNAF